MTGYERSTGGSPPLAYHDFTLERRSFYYLQAVSTVLHEQRRFSEFIVFLIKANEEIEMQVFSIS